MGELRADLRMAKLMHATLNAAGVKTQGESFLFPWSIPGHDPTAEPASDLPAGVDPLEHKLRQQLGVR